MVDAVSRRGPAPPEPGREQQRRLPVHRRGHRHRLRPEARVRAHRRQHQADRRGRRHCQHRRRHRREDLRPRRPAARDRRPRHQPRDRDVLGGRHPEGHLLVQVCPFDDPTAPFLPPGNYVAGVTTSDTAGPSAGGRGVPAALALLHRQPHARLLRRRPRRRTPWSAAGSPATAAPRPTGAVPQRRGPRPVGHARRQPASASMTTVGNNANTHEAWASPLTPGRHGAGAGRHRRVSTPPTSPTRGTTPAATRPSSCPGGNDIDATVTNLFVAHNRMHDYSYYLGFTEENYNLQASNFGRGGAEGDQEVGNAQAGALTGGTPSFLGRDNANQIALQDGVPGITNQYLFQPIAGAFYAPCVDGAMDMGIVGHEYTHAISNRMIGGPDEGITSAQGGAMGESWGDLTAGEYMFSHGYRTAATRGRSASTRPATSRSRSATTRSTTTRSTTPTSASTPPAPRCTPTARSGTAPNWEVRQALVKKWNKRFPYADKALQLRCAQATETPDAAAGHPVPGQPPLDPAGLRRLPAPAGRDLDARRPRRDARRRPDALRRQGPQGDVGGVRRARHGQGRVDAERRLVQPDAELRLADGAQRDRPLRRQRRAARSTSVTTRPARRRSPTRSARRRSSATRSGWCRAGTRCSAVSKSRGFKRFRSPSGRASTSTVRLRGRKNLAAAKNGAKVLAATAGSLNPTDLIDGTERTAWGGVTADNVDATKPYVSRRPGRRCAPDPPGAGERDADPGAGEPDRPAARQGPRPGLRLAVHRAAEVRARGLREEVRRAPTRPGSGSTPRRATRSRRSGRDRSRRT